jgi:hypothetical protein
MDRYSKSLSDHVQLVHRHAEFLVKRLAIYAKRLRAIEVNTPLVATEPLPVEVQELICRMKDIQLELMVIYDYVKENWPEAAVLIDALKEIHVEKKEDQTYQQE